MSRRRGDSARLVPVAAGQEERAGPNRWVQAPGREKPSAIDLLQRKRTKLVSSEWNWIGDRLEQPVQSRENLIPPVLFTRLILIRCEETAGRGAGQPRVWGGNCVLSVAVGSWPEHWGRGFAQSSPWLPASRGSCAWLPGLPWLALVGTQCVTDMVTHLSSEDSRGWTRFSRPQSDAAIVREALLPQAFRFHHLLRFGDLP